MAPTTRKPNKELTLHCVRCHAEYPPGVPNKCQVPHVFDPDTAEFYDQGGEEVYEISATCCSVVVEKVEDGKGRVEYRMSEVEPRYCFNGAHTSDLREVQYKNQIVACTPGICSRESLREVDERPIFESDITASSTEDLTLHCVRCHVNYSPLVSTVCMVPHVFDADTTQFYDELDDGDGVYEISATCCSAVVEKVADGKGKGEYLMSDIVPRYCFSGPHTTDERRVKYKNQILPCTPDVCSREPLRETGHQPLFAI